MPVQKIKTPRLLKKKANLDEAKVYFPIKINKNEITATKEELVEWFRKNRYYSWKQKGLNGDYYKDGHCYRFKQDKAVLFKLRFT